MADDQSTSQAPATTPPKPLKPGYKTTEFWLALAAKLLGAAFAVGLIGDGTEIARLCGLAAVVLTSLGYTVNRTLLKQAAMAFLVCMFAHTAAACGPSAREKTISTTIASLDAASSAFVKFDAAKQHEIIVSAKDKPSADAELATWRAEQSKVEQLLAAGYRAAAIAAQLDTDTSTSALIQAALIFGQELKALKVIP